MREHIKVFGTLKSQHEAGEQTTDPDGGAATDESTHFNFLSVLDSETVYTFKAVGRRTPIAATSARFSKIEQYSRLIPAND